MGRVLVVESSPELQIIIRRSLASHHEAIAAQTIVEAKSEIARGEFDLVLLDIVLPDGDGYQLCTQIRADGKHSEVPIIFLTAKNELVDKIMAFSLGADDYLLKP